MDTNAAFTTTITTAINEPHQRPSALYLDQDVDLTGMLEGITAEQASTIIPGAGNSLAQQISHLLTTFDAHQRQIDGTSMDDMDWGAAWNLERVSDEEWRKMQADYANAVRSFSANLQGSLPVSEDEMIQAATMAAVHQAFHIGQIQLLANLVRAN